MENRGSQGGHENDSAGRAEWKRATTGGWLERLQDKISKGTFKISESTLIFVCHLKWVKAREITCILIGPEAVENLVRPTGVSLEFIEFLLPCNRQRAAEILAMLFSEFDLAKVLDLRRGELRNQLPVIIPTDVVPVIKYAEIPAKRHRP